MLFDIAIIGALLPPVKCALMPLDAAWSGLQATVVTKNNTIKFWHLLLPPQAPPILPSFKTLPDHLVNYGRTLTQGLSDEDIKQAWGLVLSMP